MFYHGEDLLSRTKVKNVKMALRFKLKERERGYCAALKGVAELTPISTY